MNNIRPSHRQSSGEVSRPGVPQESQDDFVARVEIPEFTGARNALAKHLKRWSPVAS
jgi:hypothetical protein